MMPAEGLRWKLTEGKEMALWQREIGRIKDTVGGRYLLGKGIRDETAGKKNGKTDEDIRWIKVSWLHRGK